MKSWLIGKDSDAGRDWGQEKKGMTEDEMAGWHHWLNVCESEWTLGVGDGQGGLACCDSWGRKESDMTERLNWTGHLEKCVVHSNLYLVIYLSIHPFVYLAALGLRCSMRDLVPWSGIESRPPTLGLWSPGKSPGGNFLRKVYYSHVTLICSYLSKIEIFPVREGYRSCIAVSK